MKSLSCLMLALAFSVSAANAGDFETVKVGVSKVVFTKARTIHVGDDAIVIDSGIDGKTCTLDYLADRDYFLPAGTQMPVYGENNNTLGQGLFIFWGPLLGTHRTGAEGTEMINCDAGLTLQQIQAMLKTINVEIR